MAIRTPSSPSARTTASSAPRRLTPMATGRSTPRPWLRAPTASRPPETNAAGTTGAAAPVSLTVPDSRFTIADLPASTSAAVIGSDYSGHVSYLQAQYGYSGADNVVLGAKVANVFLYGGSGEDALAAKAGSNVLDGGSGSNWLVGASGADGGKDTFFVDGGNGQSTWDTLLNFHAGDMLTLWGYNGASGSLSWSTTWGPPATRAQPCQPNSATPRALAPWSPSAARAPAARISSPAPAPPAACPIWRSCAPPDEAKRRRVCNVVTRRRSTPIKRSAAGRKVPSREAARENNSL